MSRWAPRLMWPLGSHAPLRSAAKGGVGSWTAPPPHPPPPLAHIQSPILSPASSVWAPLAKEAKLFSTWYLTIPPDTMDQAAPPAWSLHKWSGWVNKSVCLAGPGTQGSSPRRSPPCTLQLPQSGQRLILVIPRRLHRPTKR